MPAPLPADEMSRLAALRALDLGEIEDDPIVEAVVILAARIFDAPICAVSVIGGDSHRYMAKVGVEDGDVARGDTFCAHTILGEDLLIVKDATRDDRFANNPFVVGSPHIRFYAGAPLQTRAGSQLGALCVVDTKARDFVEKDQLLLKGFARVVSQAFLLRSQSKAAGDALAGMESLAKEQALHLAQISHELKTPLNQIAGFSEIMKGELFGPMGHAKYKEYVEIIGHSSRHLNALVDNAMSVGKASYGVGLKCEALELHADLAAVVSAFQLACARKSQKILLPTRASPVFVASDPRALRQILTNVLSNAIKFSPAGSEIRVVVDLDKGRNQAIVTVSDAGCGIPDSVLNILGQPFVRALNPDVEGSGLGLRLTKSLAQAVGAGLQIASSGKNNGTNVALSLPLAFSNLQPAA